MRIRHSRPRRRNASIFRLLVTFFLTLTLILSLPPLGPSEAASPASGTLEPAAAAPVTWVGTAPGGVSASGEASCIEGVNCESFRLTLLGQPAEWVGKLARVELRWLSPSSDYDFYIHKGTPDGPIVDKSDSGLTVSERAAIDPSRDGTGDFFIHVVYFAATAADQYGGSASVIQVSGPPPAPIASGLPPRYQNHTPTQDQIAAGMSRNVQDEPNIGVNWLSGKVMIQALLQTLRVTFNDSVCPTTPVSSWEDKSFTLTSTQSFDPILFTDRETGRTFVSQLLFGTTESAMAYTNNDGDTWIPSQGAGISSGIDHQTVGGGPFHAPLTTGVGYKNAVYYCAQNVADANCALSLDGGQTFGPAVPIYDFRICAGLHGHIKVAPDGTAYVPNKGCGGGLLEDPTFQAVVVSEDNGITWQVRTVPGSAPSGSDPSVAIDKSGRVYFGYAHGNNIAAVAVSDDRGRNWTNIYDVGAQAGIKGVAFPAMVAGDGGRAAMAFYGTTSEGNFTDQFSFRGNWHLYVAHTYDGGESWVTVNATPNDALQLGGLWLGGGGEIHRNLLDFFDATLDAAGRVLVGYADGCRGACNQAPAIASGNSYTAFSTIARQSGGRRLIAQFDPAEPTIPGAPRLTVTRNGSLTKLSWSQSDNGGVPITGYKVFRQAPGEPEKLLAQTGPATEYTDQSGNPFVAYTYRVVAINAVGESCGTNALVAAPKGSSCATPGIRVVDDRAGDQTGAPANADLDIRSISIGEPFLAEGLHKLAFTMKVGDLSTLLPNRQWRVIWNFPRRPEAEAPFVGRFYAGMNTDATGNVSFEYGSVTNEAPTLINTFTPNRIGTPDPESSFKSDGTITIVLSADKIGNPQPADQIGGLLGRTFPGTAIGSMRSELAADTVSFADTYAVVGNTFCKTPPPTIDCFEDNDAKVAYSAGWHLVSSGNASDGHFHYNTGSDRQHGMSFTFDVSPGATGALVYHYAQSAKGGTADVYIDNVFRDTINYRGSAGTNRDPKFGLSRRYDGMAPGAHSFELRNLSGPVFVDRFCLENAFGIGQAAAGPGQTSSGLNLVGLGGTLLENVQVPANATAISIVAEAGAAVPIRLLLVDPSGVVLQAADSSNGIAVIEPSVVESGLYIMRVVNLSLGPVQVWTLATPRITR